MGPLPDWAIFLIYFALVLEYGGVMAIMLLRYHRRAKAQATRYLTAKLATLNGAILLPSLVWIFISPAYQGELFAAQRQWAIDNNLWVIEKFALIAAGALAYYFWRKSETLASDRAAGRVASKVVVRSKAGVGRKR